MSGFQAPLDRRSIQYVLRWLFIIIAGDNHDGLSGVLERLNPVNFIVW